MTGRLSFDNVDNSIGSDDGSALVLPCNH